MRYWWVLWLLLTKGALGQTIISGKVMQPDQSPIPGANVTIQPVGATTILAFGITNQKGEYTIRLQYASDSVVVKAYGMGFTTEQRTLPNRSQEISFLLSEQEVALKELVVRAPPITRTGDTLSYSVKSFKTQADRSIGDVIKRLPGIDIQPDGSILYQGRPINKYYIEGLNLLDNRYRLANDNLPADAVTQVEILENHQPIRLLDSLVTSENAAINIRLKNTLTTTGTARVGLGARPLLWDVNLTPMLFTRKQQMIASYQSNNTGQNAAQQIRTMTIEDIQNPFDKELSKKNWVRIFPISPPTFSDTRWLDNNIHLGSLNFLKKLNQSYELKLNLSYLNDQQQQAGGTRTISYTPTDTIAIIEDKRNQFRVNRLEGTLALERNDRGHYLSNQLAFNRQWDQETGLLRLNGNPLTQQVNSPFYGLSNHLKDVFKLNQQLITVQSFVRFQHTPQRLSVSPGPFEALLNDTNSYEKLTQEVNLRTFFTHNMVSLTKSLGKGFSISPQLGVQYEKQHLGSSLLPSSDWAVPTSLGEEFTNTLDWVYRQAYSKLKTQYRKDKWQVTLTTPLSFHGFSLRDDPLQSAQKRQQLTFEPQLNSSYELNTYLTVSGSLSRQNQFGKIEDVFYGYLLRNYRTIERRDAPLPANISQGGSLSLSYRNPISSVFGHLIASRRSVLNNILYSTQLSANGTTESVALASQNRSSHDFMTAQISKYFMPLKTTIGLSGQYTQVIRPQILNGLTTQINNRQTTVGFRFSGNPVSWADWEYQYQRLHFRNTVDERKLAPSLQQQHQLNLNFYPIAKLYIGFKNEYYVNRLVTQKNRILFSDLIVRYTLPKRNIDLETSLNNLWNTSELVLVSTSAFNYLESGYQLRPRQLMQRVRFSF